MVFCANFLHCNSVVTPQFISRFIRACFIKTRRRAGGVAALWGMLLVLPAFHLRRSLHYYRVKLSQRMPMGLRGSAKGLRIVLVIGNSKRPDISFGWAHK